MARAALPNRLLPYGVSPGPSGGRHGPKEGARTSRSFGVDIGEDGSDRLVVDPSAEALGLQPGDRVRAVIKSTEVMIDKP